VVATVQRGEIRWADLGEPRGSGPAGYRPVLVVQADAFNRSRISTVVVVAITSNLRLAAAPGNVLIAQTESGLPKESVINVSQIVTLDRADLVEPRVGALHFSTLAAVDAGIRLILDM
jgi:mRNA interferase MazF